MDGVEGEQQRVVGPHRAEPRGTTSCGCPAEQRMKLVLPDMFVICHPNDTLAPVNLRSIG